MDSAGKATTAIDLAMKTADPSGKAATMMDPTGKAATSTDPTVAATKKGEGGRAGPTRQWAAPVLTR